MKCITHPHSRAALLSVHEIDVHSSLLDCFHGEVAMRWSARYGYNTSVGVWGVV